MMCARWLVGRRDGAGADSRGGADHSGTAARALTAETVASVTARRTRQYPVDFGHSSSFVETIDEPGVEAADGVLAAMRDTGLAEVEFEYDRRDGRYKLLEANPRTWTWHALCRRAGVDFPDLLWLASHGSTRSAAPRSRGREMGAHEHLISWPRVVRCDVGNSRFPPDPRLLRAPIESATFAETIPCRACWISWVSSIRDSHGHPILTNPSPAPWQPGPSTLPTAVASTTRFPEAS